MLSDTLFRLQLLRAAVERFFAALESREPKYTVTQVARRFGRGRGRGAGEGVRVHAELFGEPDWLLEREVAEAPFPLAWRFRFGWLYGVADRVLFFRGELAAVIEVKSYVGVRGSERVQVSLYALLASLNLLSKPRAYLRTPEQLVEVLDWESIALSALQRAAHSS